MSCEMKIHRTLFVAHQIFELLEASALPLEDQASAVRIVSELVKQDGYDKVSLTKRDSDAPSRSHDTRGNHAVAMGT